MGGAASTRAKKPREGWKGSEVFGIGGTLCDQIMDPKMNTAPPDGSGPILKLKQPREMGAVTQYLTRSDAESLSFSCKRVSKVIIDTITSPEYDWPWKEATIRVMGGVSTNEMGPKQILDTMEQCCPDGTFWHVLDRTSHRLPTPICGMGATLVPARARSRQLEDQIMIGAGTSAFDIHKRSPQSVYMNCMPGFECNDTVSISKPLEDVEISFEEDTTVPGWESLFALDQPRMHTDMCYTRGAVYFFGGYKTTEVGFKPAIINSFMRMWLRPPHRAQKELPTAVAVPMPVFGSVIPVDESRAAPLDLNEEEREGPVSLANTRKLVRSVSRHSEDGDEDEWDLSSRGSLDDDEGSWNLGVDFPTEEEEDEEEDEWERMYGDACDNSHTYAPPTHQTLASLDPAADPAVNPAADPAVNPAADPAANKAVNPAADTATGPAADSPTPDLSAAADLLGPPSQSLTVSVSMPTASVPPLSGWQRPQLRRVSSEAETEGKRTLRRLSSDDYEGPNGEKPRWSYVQDLSEMAHPRGAAAVVAYRGDIYVMGGCRHERHGPNPLSCMEVYRSRTDTWEIMPAMPTPRWGANAAVVNGVVYVMGGVVGGRRWQKEKIGGDRRDRARTTNIVEAFDISKEVWYRVADMKSARTGAASVVMGGYIYIMGGFSHQPLKKVERMKALKTPSGVVKQGLWVNCEDMQTPRAGAAAVVINRPNRVWLGAGSAIPKPAKPS